jgi:S-adenosyl-L-methionine hydrolase (adenosine-forming)
LTVTAHTFVSFLSDFGHTDEFVGVCHAVMLEFAPHVRVVDITHEIPPHDVRAGALTLSRSVQYLPVGIVLAVVDPGVGTDRRIVAVEAGRGVLVGPDNGLLAPAVAMLGGARRVVSLTNDEFHLEGPGHTFAARDIMAPAVGHLADGIPLEQLGEIVDPSTLVPGLLPLPEFTDGVFAAEVLWIDRFGNCQLNIGPDDLTEVGVAPGDAVEVRLGDRTHLCRWVRAYADARPSELVMVVDSYGLCSLALDRNAASTHLGLRPGGQVQVAVPQQGTSE